MSRLKHRGEEHDELAGAVAEHVGMQAGEDELGDMAELSLEPCADDGGVGTLTPNALKEGEAFLLSREVQGEQHDLITAGPEGSFELRSVAENIRGIVADVQERG